MWCFQNIALFVWISRLVQHSNIISANGMCLRQDICLFNQCREWWRNPFKIFKKSTALIILLICFSIYFFLVRCSDLARQMLSLAKDRLCDMRDRRHTHIVDPNIHTQIKDYSLVYCLLSPSESYQHVSPLDRLQQRQLISPEQRLDSIVVWILNIVTLYQWF